MILKCQACSRIKKFGEWVEIPEELSEIIEYVKVIKMLCPQCQGNVLSMPSADKVVLKRAGTDVVDTISL
ncbi:MAG: hypothetical protein ACE5KK_00120 [Candidatus Brocadiales bacterium]